MSFNYSRLAGRIKECYGTQGKFAEAMKLSERGLSLKMNNRLPWKQTEMMRASKLLKIKYEEINLYFFEEKVQSNELEAATR